MKKSKIKDIATNIGAFYAVTYLISKFADADVTKFSWVYLLSYIGVHHILKFRPNDREEALIGDGALRVLAVLLSWTMITGIYFDHGLPFENMTAGIFFNYLICIVGFMPLCKGAVAVVFRWIYMSSCNERNINEKSDSRIIIGGGGICIYTELLVYCLAGLLSGAVEL